MEPSVGRLMRCSEPRRRLMLSPSRGILPCGEIYGNVIMIKDELFHRTQEVAIVGIGSKREEQGFERLRRFFPRL